MTMPRNPVQGTNEFGGSDETYAAFRNFTAQGEMGMEQVITYFTERMAIERIYFESLDRLAKKITADPNNSNSDRTAIKAWASIAQLTNALSSHHQQLASCLKAIVQDLYKARQIQQQTLDESRQTVKRQSKEYYEMKLHGVPKLKHSYFKRHKDMEALEKENKEGVGNPKTLKLAKDITSAEQGYRRGIQDLEEIRQRFQLVREQTQKTCERVEWDRVLALKNALGTYTEAEGKLMKVGGEAVDRCSIFVECMSPQVDCHFFVADFMRIWPDATPMYYESYTHGIAKDMVFGVPLETLLRAHPGSGIPAVLYKCVRAVEARGLDKEGIYRVSGKHSDVLELKLRVEKDVHSVNLEDESWDVHVIAGLVKMYLRQLPVPVFPFPAKERTEYSQIADEKERVLRLRARVKALPRSHHTVLKFLAEHLAKIASHASQNKMTPQNISLIFAPVIFQGHPDLDLPPPSLAAQLFGGKNAGDKPPDLSHYDIYKADNVLEDMIVLREWVFGSELPRPVLGDRNNKASIPQRTDSLPERKVDPKLDVHGDVGGLAGTRERPVSTSAIPLPLSPPVPMDRRSSMNHVFASPPPPPPPPRPSTPPFDGEDEPYRDDLTPEDERVEVVVTPLTVVNKGDDSGDEGEVGGSRAGGDGDRPPVPDKI